MVGVCSDSSLLPGVRGPTSPGWEIHIPGVSVLTSAPWAGRQSTLHLHGPPPALELSFSRHGNWVPRRNVWGGGFP